MTFFKLLVIFPNSMTFPGLENDICEFHDLSRFPAFNAHKSEELLISPPFIFFFKFFLLGVKQETSILFKLNGQPCSRLNILINIYRFKI